MSLFRSFATSAKNQMRKLIRAFKRSLKLRGLYIPYLEGFNHYCVLASSDSSSNLPEDNGFPVPPPNLLLGYSYSREQYLNAGKRDVENMLRILQDAGGEISAESRVLDFGCGSGRMIRWVKTMSAVEALCGVDINGNHVHWCRRNLSPGFRFMVTTTVPHLPFEDNSFDLVYSGSVFTHIEDTTEAWLSELRRITKPDRWVYITFHDEETIRILEHEWKNTPEALTFRSKEATVRYNEFAGADFDYFSINRWDESQVFYAREFFRKLVGDYFEVQVIEPRAYGKQSGLLGRKRSH